MTEGAFELTVVTPENKMMAVQAQLATIPGTEGDFGVLQGHIDMVALVKPGLLKINAEHNRVTEFLVSYGICRITNGVCALMVDDAILVQNIKEDDVSKRMDVCEKEIALSKSSAEIKRLKRVMVFLKLCLKHCA